MHPVSSRLTAALADEDYGRAVEELKSELEFVLVTKPEGAESPRHIRNE